MFKSREETDKRGCKQLYYYLTQGDSCTIYATPKNNNGDKLPISDFQKCVFKLSNIDYEQEFIKELTTLGDDFVLRLTAEETQNFSIDVHMYEFEYTLTSGEVQTPNQYKFEILPQIVKKNEG